MCKWFFGWLNFVVPMLASALCLQLVALRWPGTPLIRALFASLSIATIFYSMTCCFAPRKSSEAFVGFVGLIVFLLSITHIAIIEGIFNLSVIDQEGPSYLHQTIIFVNPIYWIPLSVKQNATHLNMTLFVAIQAILFACVIGVGLRKWKRNS